jgi:PAS domain S-box-containing protein
VRRTFFTFAAFIAAVFIVVGMAFFIFTNTLLKNSLETIYKRDLAMMEVVTQGDLAVSDYEKIEDRVLLWGEQDPNIVRLRFVLDEDIVLVEYLRHGQNDNDSVLGMARETYSRRSPLGRAVTLELEYDLSEYFGKSRILALVLISLGILGAAIFIASLWLILQRMAIVPFQKEVAERKRAESELERSRRFLQTVVDGFPESMLVINTDHSIAMANKSTAETTGKNPSDLIGLSCFTVSHDSTEPCHEEDHLCPLKKVLETKGTITVEHIHLDAQGNERTIELAAAPIFDENDDVVQIIESCRDITARKEAEDAKLQLERQVQHAQKLESLGVLAGGVAHDFNNILMGVLGYAELSLLKLPPESPVRDNVQNIVSSAVRAAELAKQMLAYSGKGRFVVESIDVNRTIEEMVHLLKATLSKTAVLKFNLSKNIPDIQADVTQVRQVFMNVITNASESIEEKTGVITVSTGVMEVGGDDLEGVFVNQDVTEGYYTFIEVSDTGCGMDSETQEKIFDPFFTTKFTGRGLGLAATLGIIRGHKGAIKVHSEPGKGTTIKVLFPCSSEEALDNEDTTIGDNSEPTPERWRRGGTILIVDDEEAVRAVAKQTLARHGFNVLVAEDGKEGLRVFGENSDAITLVLLDMTMPHMGGEETFNEMRKMRPDVQVVLSSGYNEQEATSRFAGKGLAGFIQKPYRPTELVQKLHELLEIEGATE